MKKRGSRAWEEYKEDEAASGGGNTLRGIARIALTCFVQKTRDLETKLAEQQMIIEKFCNFYNVAKIECCAEHCNAYVFADEIEYPIAKFHCEEMLFCDTCSIVSGNVFCDKHATKCKCCEEYLCYECYLDHGKKK